MLNTRSQTAFFVVAVILISANLRSPLIAVGPLLGTIQEAINANTAIMGMIGTIPVFTFGVVSPFAARLAKKFGIENVMIVGIVLMILGGILRSAYANAYLIMAGTVLLCTGMALESVLLTGVIRRDQPKRVERMSAIEMFSFCVVAAIASATAVPIAQSFGWEWGIGIWSLLNVPAFFAWIKIRNDRCNAKIVEEKSTSDLAIWKSRLAWLIAFYYGMQALVFYTLVTFLASVIVARGFSTEDGGFYNTVFQLIALPTIIIITPIAEKYPKMHHLILGSSLIVAVGLLGIWYAPISLMWLASGILGIGCCCTFTFALMLLSMRGDDAHESAELSGMGQTVGYFVAALGPVAFGALSDWTHSWELSVIFLVSISIAMSVVAWFAGKPGSLHNHVTSPPQPKEA